MFTKEEKLIGICLISIMLLLVVNTFNININSNKTQSINKTQLSPIFIKVRNINSTHFIYDSTEKYFNYSISSSIVEIYFKSTMNHIVRFYFTSNNVNYTIINCGLCTIPFGSGDSIIFTISGAPIANISISKIWIQNINYIVYQNVPQTIGEMV